MIEASISDCSAGFNRDVLAGSRHQYHQEVVAMSNCKRHGPGPSHVLLTPDRAGNVVGVDSHKRTLSASVLDARAGLLASAHFSGVR